MSALKPARSRLVFAFVALAACCRIVLAGDGLKDGEGHAGARPLELRGPAGLALAFSDDGRRLLSAGKAGSRVWDVETATPVGADFPAHENDGYPPSLGPGGRMLLTATRNPREPTAITARVQAELWDVDGHAVRHQFRPRGMTMKTAACSPDGSCVATAGGGQLVLWDAETGKELFATDYPRSLRSLEFVARGSLLLATVTEGPWYDADGRALPQRDDLPSRGHYILVWDVATGRLVAAEGANLWSYQEDDPEIAGCRPAAASPDGTRLIVREFEGWGAWDLATGRHLASQCTHCQEDSSHQPPFPIGGAATWVAFAEDGKRFVTVGPRAQTVLWESLDLTQARVLDAERGWRSARFSADGRRPADRARPVARRRRRGNRPAPEPRPPARPSRRRLARRDEPRRVPPRRECRCGCRPRLSTKAGLIPTAREASIYRRRGGSAGGGRNGGKKAAAVAARAADASVS